MSAEQPENAPERRVFAEVDFNGEAVEAHEENTVIFRHLGAAALYDHVFVIHPSEEMGGYVWRNHPPNNENYTKMLKLAKLHRCMAHINLREAGTGDIEAFNRAVLSDLDGVDGVPEGWE